MTSRLSNGDDGLFEEKVMPLLLRAIRREEEAGVAMIVILTNVSDRLHSRVPIIVPFDLLHKMTAAVRSESQGRRIIPI